MAKQQVLRGAIGAQRAVTSDIKNINIGGTCGEICIKENKISLENM